MAARNQTQRKSIDEEFADNNYNPGWGVSNAKVAYGGTTARPANQNRPLVQYQELNSYSNNSAGETIGTNQNAAPTQAPGVRRKKTRLAVIKQRVRIIGARLRASPIAIGISIWAWPWYFCIQLPLAVIALISIAIAHVFYTTAGSSTVTVLSGIFATGALQGMSGDVFLVIYFAFTFIIFLSYATQIAISTGLFSVGFVRSWFGKGITFKFSSILIILISSFVPFLNMLPLLGLWIIAVILNPK